jgi:ABC-type multidrug transport system fused ATPase/permease subunit
MSIFYDVKDFMDNKERLNLLDEFLEEMPKPNKISRKQNTTTPEVFQKQFVKIEIKDLNFKYQKTQIFQDFNLTINRKEKIGLVGSIGSGKSTLVKLLVGLKINYNGKILINGRDVKSLNIDKMRNYITYIPQHPKLFNRTLFENITYGLEGVTEKQIYDILDSVGLDDVKDRFKKMMREKVGKNGSELSGGQRQIVWLVRSLLKDNRMIILDEPTSSLDEDNKDKVVKLIEELSKKRNIILISHDKTVLENMDRVIRLDKGKIVSDTQI